MSTDEAPAGWSRYRWFVGQILVAAVFFAVLITWDFVNEAHWERACHASHGTTHGWWTRGLCVSSDGRIVEVRK